jgi:CubicO group peptidase (beta-lactamase class C family)
MYSVLIAIEEGSIDLYEPAGPDGSTVRHLLAHAAGYGFDSGSKVIVPPGRRRIYSNQGIEVLADHLTTRTGIDFATYQREAVFEPLALTATELRGSPAAHVWSTARDVSRFVAELFEPTLVSPASLLAATTAHFPDLEGVVPGYGRFAPCPWGLGFELKGDKHPHWMGTRTGPDTFGHFGGSGTFVWIEPHREIALVVLTDREFGDWAHPLWSDLSDEVIADHG